MSRCFDEVTEEKCYDGIWASASLLHVAKKELPEVLARLKRALTGDVREGRAEEMWCNLVVKIRK